MLRFRILLAAFAATCAASSVHAQICTPFTDVPASDPFCADIQWMLNRGVTFGCHGTGQPPAYCPANPVRRDQMAAFMFRLSHDVVFQDGGNAFGNPAVLGTTDNNALDIRVNNARVMRYEPNAISPNVIGGSPANSVTVGVRGATIAGGGVPSNADPNFGGPAPNQVTDAYGTVGGGYANRAGDDDGTTVDAAFATVGGGRSNTASGPFSTVAGGAANLASGDFSTVAGGLFNTASGFTSFAAGRFANANDDGCFVWGDLSTSNEVRCDAANRFMVRSIGGIYMWAGGNTQATYFGVELPPGATAWVVSSDRRLKDNLHMVDTRDVLERLLAVPITTWNLKTQDSSIRHMGPMAQDFRAAFGLGETELGISTLDADGVAFAAIQGLNAKLEAERAAKDAEIATLRAELAEIRSLLTSRTLQSDAARR